MTRKRNSLDFVGPGGPGFVPDPETSHGWFLRDDGVWAPSTEGGVDGYIPISQIRSPNETVYGDYLTSGTAVRTGVSAPSFSLFTGGMYLFAFSGSGPTEQAFFTVHIQHDLKVNTAPTFHVHWSHTVASPTGDVKWYLDYIYADGYENGAFPTTATSLSTVQTAGAQYAHHITPDDMLAPSNMEPDGQLICRLYRDSSDAQDTFGSDAFLIGVDLHYELGQLATAERNRPFTSAGFGS